MKKIEEEFIKELDVPRESQKSFADIMEKIDVDKFREKEKHSGKALHRVVAAVAAVLLLAAIILPVAIYFSSVEAPLAGIFDRDDITIDVLKEKNCLFYENLVFAEDSKNHVFVTKGDEITEHHSFDKVAFNKNSFDSVYSKSMIDAVACVGLPSFVGISSELSLDYSCIDGYIRRLKLTKNGDELFIDDIEVLNKEDSTTWFDPDKTDLPSLEQCQQIKVGMSLDEVVRRIGKPQRDVGSGANLFRFDIDNGLYLTVLLILDVDEENQYHDNNPDSTVYGTHALYVAECWIHEYTVPPVDTL